METTRRRSTLSTMPNPQIVEAREKSGSCLAQRRSLTGALSVSYGTVEHLKTFRNIREFAYLEFLLRFSPQLVNGKSLLLLDLEIRNRGKRCHVPIELDRVAFCLVNSAVLSALSRSPTLFGV